MDKWTNSILANANKNNSSKEVYRKIFHHAMKNKLVINSKEIIEVLQELGKEFHSWPSPKMIAQSFGSSASEFSSECTYINRTPHEMKGPGRWKSRTIFVYTDLKKGEVKLQDMDKVIFDFNPSVEEQKARLTKNTDSKIRAVINQKQKLHNVMKNPSLDPEVQNCAKDLSNQIDRLLPPHKESLK